MTDPTEPERPSPGMKLVSMRMSEETWEAVQREAEIEGVSASEFIREAVVFRLGYRWAARMKDDEVAARLRKLGLVFGSINLPG